MVILSHGRRKLVHHALTAHPTAEWVARQIVGAFPWDEAPRYLVRNRDAVYGEVVKRRLRGLGIRDRPIAPRSPWQNAFVERLIGSVRCERHTGGGLVDLALLIGAIAFPTYRNAAGRDGKAVERHETPTHRARRIGEVGVECNGCGHEHFCPSGC